MNKLFQYTTIIMLSSVTMACSMGSSDGDFPMDVRQTRKVSHGKLTGEKGLTIFGTNDSKSDEKISPIGVNSFLWRATLDTLSFMPMTSADPFGGVIITDWYEDPNKQGERFKINALILDRSLRVDGIKISVFKQRLDEAGNWRDAAVSPTTAKKLEDTILTRARQMKINQNIQ